MSTNDSIFIDFKLNKSNICQDKISKATTQLINYVIITYFFRHFWLQTNVTKK